MKNKIPIKIEKIAVRKSSNKLRIFYILILLLIPLFIFLLPHAERGKISKKDRVIIITDKDKYYRYELVKIKVKVLDEENKPIKNAKLRARIYHNNKLVYTLGYISQLNLNYDDKKNLYYVNWPIPFNPKLGRYKVEVVASYEISKKIVKRSNEKEVSLPLFKNIKIKYPTDKKEEQPQVITKKVKEFIKKYAYFEIISRKNKVLKDNLYILTIETNLPLLNLKIKTPEGDEKNWQGIFDWAKFIGVNTIFYLVGQTTNQKGINTKPSIWTKNNLEIYPVLAKETKLHNLKFGAWIASFFTFGNIKHPKYKYAIIYSPEKGRCIESNVISLLDKKRIDDIVKLVKELDDNPHIDYIGLDYIRSAEGGYEMVDEFVKEMNPPLPKKFFEFNKQQRINYLSKNIALYKNIDIERRDLYEMWCWWKAHKIALIVKEIKHRANLKKPLFTFILGWKHGLQHGQDPIMLTDAGVDFIAVMLYEIDKERFPVMIKDWQNYLNKTRLNLLAGNIIDFHLHQKMIKPISAPEEYYNRLMEGFNKLNGGKRCNGIFIHDLSRLLWGRKGNYSTYEWAIATKKTISKAKQISNL